MSSENATRADIDKVWNEIGRMNDLISRLDRDSARADQAAIAMRADLSVLGAKIDAMTVQLNTIAIAMAGASGGMRAAIAIAAGFTGLIGFITAHIWPLAK